MVSGKWAGSKRKDTLPPDWHRVRPRILRRDRYRCQWGSMAEDEATYGRCNLKANQVDHMGDNTDHSDENLRSLCAPHHGKRSGRQGGNVGKARAASRLRPMEKHPSEL